MNAKVRCINDSGSCHTSGKIYEVKDGIMETDRCDTMQMWGYKPFESIEDINSQLNSKFELVEEEKMFSKSDLKVGYVVEHRNGDIAMVSEYSDGKSLVQDNGVYTKFDCVRDDLSVEFSKSYDIMKVFGFTPNQSMARNSKTINRPLLWKRTEIIELTIEEIAKKFGVESDRIRIKE